MTSADPHQSVVLYPSSGMGHLRPMVELAKLLHRHGLSVTILIVEPHYHHGTTSSLIDGIAASNPSISFHRLPPIVPPSSPSRHGISLTFDLHRLSNPNLLSFLKTSTPSALIVDFFCSYAFDVSAELQIPTYIFFPSSASFLALFLHFPLLHTRILTSFRELGPTIIDVPGLAPLPADHLPQPFLDRDDDAYRGLLYISSKLQDAQGIIVNTFEALERKAADVVSGGPYAPFYPIGPMMISTEDQESECLKWLDAQARGSVVFLCFGSMGTFSEEQIKEIAIGLEGSGQRFLWVVKSPPNDDPDKRFAAPTEPDLDRLLPDGFVERTKERGMVVKSWAPQKAVLGHESVGAFVSHCGWNSTLEAVNAGVPVIAWPLHAEQRMNKVFLVEEAKLAVEMRGYDGVMVRAEEVEAKIRRMMESEGGKEFRERAAKAKDSGMVALKEGGSSYTASMNLVRRLKQGEWRQRP